MIRLGFRLDDPSETSHQGVEAGIMELLRRHKAPATFATIPFRIVDGERRPLSTARARPMVEAQRAGLIEIAQHGHTHLRHKSEPAPPTEFSGRPRTEQHALIAEGKRHLESIFDRPISGFVPPWNNYDAETVRCLTELGFDYLSAGWEMPAADHRLLRLLPRTAQLKDFDTAFAEAKRFEGAKPIIVFVMHHYDFAESDAKGAILDLAHFDHVLERALAHPGTRISTLAELARELTVSNRQLALQHRLARSPILGRRLPHASLVNASLWRGILSMLKA